MVNPDKETETAPPQATGDRLLIGLLAGITLLVAGALGVAALRGPRYPAVFDPASPEAVIQRYVQLVRDGRMAEAGELLTSSARGSEAWRRVAQQHWETGSSSASLQIDLDSSRVDGHRATVVLAVGGFIGMP